ncbi:MAG: xanthine dehydrogenase accessory protein XdhC, partial [Sneathiella sp.]|nr:xanthine dehydrogenase accessory protein XdhC [Sneathiella sp.]
TAILVTVGAARGSTPRETGTRMLVNPSQTHGTIGGGQLEFVAIDAARKLLIGNEKTSFQLLKLPLGPELAQCCGGYTEIILSKINRLDSWFCELKKALKDKQDAAVITRLSGTHLIRSLELLNAKNSVDQNALKDSIRSGKSLLLEDKMQDESFTLIEPLIEDRFTLTVFGAGHVGKAIVHVLSPLPCHIKWVDGRAEEFPADIPANVEKIVTSHPTDIIENSDPTGLYLIMTHSHQIDFNITEALLRRGDAAYVGLIGSETKRKRFFKRLNLRGFGEDKVAKITCPIGLPYLKGKHPSEIAISVASEILALQQSLISGTQDNRHNQSHKFG